MAEEFVSACGIFDCDKCAHRKKDRCVGCSQGNALIAAHGESVCELYMCAKSRNIISCNECTESMCSFTRTLEMVCPVRARYEKKRCYARKMSDHFANRLPAVQDGALVAKKFDKVIGRLPWYLFAIQEFINHGVIRVSSDDIARKVGVKPWLVRRDLSQFGEFGRPSVGYETERLRECLFEILHLNTERKVVWVGANRLNSDKTLFQRIREHNYEVVEIFDTDLSRVPEMIGGVRVSSVADMAQRIEELDAKGAIIATDQEEAQGVADALVAAGIMGILNLTTTLIVAPPTVCVRNINIVAELFLLSYYCIENHINQASETVVDLNPLALP